jgi:tetratricopeptide (TPR) repeat protein
MSRRQPNRTKPNGIKPDGIRPTRAARIGAAIIGLALVAALVPEFYRYRSERRLHQASALFRSFIAESNAVAREPATLDAVAALATQAAANLADDFAGDSRPLILAGSARLLQRRPGDALAFYRRALGLGERAEIDLNLGRAYELAGNQVAASAAVLRAVWISPALVAALPQQVQTPLEAALAENIRRLVGHHLSAPPPLPAGDGSD